MTNDELYSLLPAIYRLRDAEQGGGLRELLAVISEQMNLVDEDIARLYDNWFIETADEWAVPYIGDLLGVRGLHWVGTADFTQRARVANELAYRRRKGTATMLEQLARDTTLWGARAVEFFKLLATTQYHNHIRLESTVTPDLRQANRLDLLDTPFDTLAHTADVRRIASQRGRHNIPNIGIFLWRLQHYALTASDPRPADPGHPDGRYFFSSLGIDTLLYNQPRSEIDISHLAEELDVPAPIRPLAFEDDLLSFLGRQAPRSPEKRPLRSQYVGPGASLDVMMGGKSLSPLQVIPMDLGSWARPPARVRGLLSGALPANIALSAALSPTSPALQVKIGDEGPLDVVLGSLPTTPGEAASALETAMRSVQAGSGAFRNVRVVLAKERLFVLPGLPGRQVTFSPAVGDATADELLLLAADVSELDAALSSRLEPFPRLTTRRMQLRIGSQGPFLVEMSDFPTSFEDARQKLESAIQAADASPEFQQAQVFTVDGCLLVLPGGAGGMLTFDEAPNDSTTVHLLGLSNRVAVDVRRGRLAFPLGEEPVDVRVHYNYGFSGDIGGGPYDRRRLRHPEESELTLYENSVAAYQQFDQIIEASVTGVPTLTDALATWDTNQRQAVIQINDDHTYQEDLTVTMGSGDLVIQAANGHRPTLIGNIVVRGTGRGRLTINGLLISGSIEIEEDDSLQQLDLFHTTLVPGITLDENGIPLEPRRPSLTARESNTLLSVNLRESISGPIRLPKGGGKFDCRNSILESPVRDQPARVVPALISGALPAALDLGESPTLQVTIGNEGPYKVSVQDAPTTRSSVRSALETALRAADDSPAFAQARVLLSGGHLVLLPGIPAPIRAEPYDTDLTALTLRLTMDESSQVFALVGGPISTLPPTAAVPALQAGSSQVQHMILVPPMNTLAQVRDALETALRGADPADGFFAQARVLADSQPNIGLRRLVILPGSAGTAMQFAPAPADNSTMNELGLQADLFVLAGSPLGEYAGSPASLECSTVLGAMHVKELSFASECIFSGVVTTEHAQSRSRQDCVRFSYLPDGSRTPPRYHCQPELAITAAINAREDQKRHDLTPIERNRIRRQILDRLVPSFTSTQYGSPAYAQLGFVCPSEIRTGAADGAEMGVFCFLMQPQREGNLRSSLDEYLRFGLEAGIFYVS